MSALLALGVVASLLAGGGVVAGRVRHVEPREVGHWLGTPVVWAGPGVDRAALTEALGWWARHGQRFALTGDAENANVQIVAVPRLNRPARTRVWQSPDGVIVEARVLVRLDAADDALVLAHELGHCAGLAHPIAPPTGTMMNGRAPGWSARGAVRGRP